MVLYIIYQYYYKKIITQVFFDSGIFLDLITQRVEVGRIENLEQSAVLEVLVPV